MRPLLSILLHMHSEEGLPDGMVVKNIYLENTGKIRQETKNASILPCTKILIVVFMCSLHSLSLSVHFV